MKKSVSNFFGKRKNLGVVVSVIGLALLFSAYINLTGFAVQSQNIIEKTATIEVWANSQIELNITFLWKFRQGGIIQEAD